MWRCLLSVRLFKAEAKRLQKLADSEADPQLKQAHVQRADEMTEWAEIAGLHTKLRKALADRKKALRPT